ncbi:FG-GAP-like repeat-containing protein [Wenzhouxiangella sp. EGI_FJ10305]|uniref:FG-GAP-like repeat-containing protein n=1 Tax=Wenzhouxiangella sp. EGI_FJ10305 TaxID=3243768 RepID=UPI0035D5C8C8
MNRFKFLLSFAVILALLIGGCQPQESELPPEAIEKNNRGVGLMGQYKNEEARQVFAELAESHPDWLAVRVNEAIATLNRQEEGDEQRALALVGEVLEIDADHVRANYVAGLMRYYLGESQRALAHFERVLEASPEDAHAAYFTAQTLAQLGRNQDALDLYERAIELDPYLRSAYYGAALVMRQTGEPEAAREKLEAYQRFANNPRAHLAEFRYTRMGPLAEARAVSGSGEPSSTSMPEGPVLAEATDGIRLPQGNRRATLTTADIDGDGQLDLFIADPDGSLVLLQRDGRFERVEDHPLSGHEGVLAAAWGDIDNDGVLDVYLCGRGANRLLSGANDWQPAAGHDDVADAGTCADVGLFDADHDGDLDIFVVNADGPNELYSNNLDGSWRRLSETSEANLEGHGHGGMVLAADLDGDRDGDIVVLHEDAPHQVLVNDRLWRYRETPAFDAFRQHASRALTVADFEASGQPALVSINDEGRVSRWLPDSDGLWQAADLAQVALEAPETVGLAALDISGNGRPEILVHHADGFEVLAWREGPVRLETLVSHSAALVALAPVLVDPDRGPSLIGLVGEQEGRRLRHWAPGPGRGHFAALAPTGRSERAEGMRSNASGIGTGIAARIGSRWALLDTYDRHSAPGQSLQPVAVGLGEHERIDFVQLHWSDGVLQTEMGLAGGELHRIAETQRQLASCPVLFAYNGEGFEFVSDLLGVAGIGFLHAPGEYSDPRPWEYFRFPEGSIAPRDGRYEIRIGEPMEEVAYLDAARLHVHDLPPGWSLALDERMHTGGGPAPTGDPVFYRDETLMPVERAVNERGEDVTEALREVDSEAAPVGERDRRFLGRLSGEHVLTLNFDEVINPADSRPVLIIDGWVEYPYSQTVFAAWQAGADYRAPTLEARAHGRWQTVHEHFGYPAGMPREMSLPLDALPLGTTALRLRTNLEVYFDRIAVVQAETPPGNALAHTLEVDRARLARKGFARRQTLDQRRPYYDYADRQPFWDTKAPTGYYTALGPVENLVTEADEAFAVIGPGEEVHFEFAAPSEPPDGYRREIVLEVRGYAKDMDLYTRDGETVGPLPGHADNASREALHRDTLTRFRGGY